MKKTWHIQQKPRGQLAIILIFAFFFSVWKTNVLCLMWLTATEKLTHTV